MVRRARAASANEDLFNLVRIAVRRVARDITLPPPLTERPIRLRIDLEESEEAADAKTVPSRAWDEPNNYWRWMTFGPRIIVNTEAWTRAAVRHELRHCADIARAKEAHSRSGRPQTRDDFLAFYETFEGGERTRHSRIYAEQARPQVFSEWSRNERILWLRAALDYAVPDNLPEDAPLPITRRVLRFYASASPSRRQQIQSEFLLHTRDLVEMSRSEETASHAQGQATTLVNHFDQVLADIPAARRNLERIAGLTGAAARPRSPAR